MRLHTVPNHPNQPFKPSKPSTSVSPPRLASSTLSPAGVSPVFGHNPPDTSFLAKNHEIREQLISAPVFTVPVQQWIARRLTAREELAQLKKRLKLGVFAEASDMVVEFIALNALRRKVINKDGIMAWRKVLLRERAPDDQHTFPLQNARLGRQLDPEKLERFTKTVRLPQETARQLLTGLQMSYALYPVWGKAPVRDFREYSAPRINRETQEWIDELPLPSVARWPAKAGMMLYNGAFKILPLPKRWHPLLPLAITRWALKMPTLDVEDLANFGVLKLWGRNLINFEFPRRELSYGETKRVVQPFEILSEAAMILKPASP